MYQSPLGVTIPPPSGITVTWKYLPSVTFETTLIKEIICFLREQSLSFNPCDAELIKMPCPLLIFSQSGNLVQIVDINSYTVWQTVQIQISWLLQKPTDLDLHCLQKQGLSGFSRTRVKSSVSIINPSPAATGYVLPLQTVLIQIMWLLIWICTVCH